MQLPQPASSGGGATYFSVGVPIASPVTSPRESQRENDYFYTLVFPNTKAPSQHDDGEIAGNGNRMRYSDAVAVLRAVTAGGREREAAVVEEFRAAWMVKFRTPPPTSRDTIPLLYFQELVRELVVQRFDSIHGLFMKTSLSLDEQSLLISFRPSKALLCATADRMHLAVAIMSEIDPGEQYWSKNPTRAAEESLQFNRQDAQEELYRLFLAGKISSEEAQIFDENGDREDAGMWSRRIHALRRFFNPEVAKVVAEQEQAATPLPPTHLPFKDRASMRYLYRHIDGGGEEPTPFRTVDKIRLTKAIIDGQFDCDALVEKGLLMHHFCMHTHHTDAVDTSIDVLRVQWGSLASPLRLYRQGFGRLSQIFHFQPIAHVRNYFGEEIALYFAYTSLYAQVLQLLVVVACASALLHAWGSVDGLSTSWYYIAFAVVNTAFVPSFLRKWIIQERVLTTEWGVTTLKDVNATRPHFRGELAISYVTHRREIYYSPRRRQLQQVASGALLLCISAGLLYVDFTLITSSAYVELASSSQLLMVNLAIAVFAKSLGSPLAALCTALTEWENYKTQPDYDASLTLKFAIVQSVNLFGVLWLQTFMLPLVSVHQQLDCHQQAAQLLTTILSVDLVVSLVDLSLPVARSLLSSLPAFPLLRSPTSPDRAHLLVSSPPSAATVALCAELDLDPYEGVMFDYAQVTITFGFIAWFAALAPLATLLAWGVAVVQIRVDAYKFCHLTQRPFPTQKNSIGSWASYLHVLAFGSWIHNAMLTVLYLAPLMSPSGMQDLSDFVLLHNMTDGADGEERRLAIETLVLVVFASFAFISFLASVHDQSDRAKLEQLRWFRVRRHFLENKYINNLDRVSDSIRDALPSGRVFLNGVHLYVVTGNKADEDAAEEILDELADLKGEVAGLQRQINILQAGGASVGTLVVEVGSINILPVMDAMAKTLDALLQMQVTTKSSGSGATASREPSSNASEVKNTSVVTSRSPVWSESHELKLHSLDEVLLLRVFDKERLRKNRRVGHATLDVSDVIATAPPILRFMTGSSSPTHEAHDEDAITPPPSPPPSPSKQAPKGPVRMASFELTLEIPAALLSTMQADLIKHGYPKLSLRCGLRLEPLGSLLYQQRKLQATIRSLQHREKQFFQWK